MPWDRDNEENLVKDQFATKASSSQDWVNIDPERLLCICYGLVVVTEQVMASKQPSRWTSDTTQSSRPPTCSSPPGPCHSHTVQQPCPDRRERCLGSKTLSLTSSNTDNTTSLPTFVRHLSHLNLALGIQTLLSSLLPPQSHLSNVRLGSVSLYHGGGQIFVSSEPSISLTNSPINIQ